MHPLTSTGGMHLSAQPRTGPTGERRISRRPLAAGPQVDPAARDGGSAFPPVGAPMLSAAARRDSPAAADGLPGRAFAPVAVEDDEVELAVADGVTAAPAPAPTPGPELVPPRLPQIGLSLQRLDRLHPAVRTRGAALLELCSHSGLAILVSQGMRTWEEQDALYAKGRTIPPLGPKYFVTRAKGGQSYHNFGLAFDIVVLDAVTKAGWDDNHPGWRRAGALGKSVGLAWGGEWARLKDLPHYQYTGGLSLPQCRDLYPSGLDELWRRVT